MIRRIVALGLTVLSLSFVQMQAEAAEGKLSESSAAPDASRTSRYSGGQAPAVSAKGGADAASSKALNHTGKPVAAKQTRAVTQMAARSSDFYIREAASTLRSDRDGDGYHAEFRIRFDANVIFGDATVYAKLYLRRAGESEWFLYHETDDFIISGDSSGDEYYVTTTLDGGYPTAEYDVLIDLFESGYDGVVATIDPLDSPSLSYLPLEEVGLDVPFGIDGYSIGNVTTELIRDTDGDGHYSRFRITFDPDTDFDRRLVYARVWVRPRGGEWIEDHVTEDFWVDSSGQSDIYALSAEWFTGYPTSFYDRSPRRGDGFAGSCGRQREAGARANTAGRPIAGSGRESPSAGIGRQHVFTRGRRRRTRLGIGARPAGAGTH
jgi:hypothetical protein